MGVKCDVRRAVRVALLLWPLTLALPGVAAAADGEQAISLSPVFATFTVNQAGVDRTGTGGALTVDYQRGFGDSFWLRGGVSGGAFAVAGQASWGGSASVALVYAVDVLRYVPYISAGAGALAVGGGTLETVVRPYLELGAGLEVEQSITFSWGIDARFGAFASQSTIFTIGPRVSWKWGYF
jgi:hypothetical protein